MKIGKMLLNCVRTLELDNVVRITSAHRSWLGYNFNFFFLIPHMPVVDLCTNQDLLSFILRA